MISVNNLIQYLEQVGLPSSDLELVRNVLPELANLSPEMAQNYLQNWVEENFNQLSDPQLLLDFAQNNEVFAQLSTVGEQLQNDSGDWLSQIGDALGGFNPFGD